MKSLTFQLDREGTLSVDGNVHSTGLFDLKSGLYVPNPQDRDDIPIGDTIVLLPDEGGLIEIERIFRCPFGEAHHHFVVE
jgi:hypothetical protein